jgi:hypothetical protein
MTAQVTETLHYRGRMLPLCTEPLAPYLEHIPPSDLLNNLCSACWRGYVGEWEIADGRLYLVGMSNSWSNDDRLTLESLFLGATDGVFAHWYSGELRCRLGRELEYVHGGYGSTYECELYLLIEGGVLTGERLVFNDSELPDVTADQRDVAAVVEALGSWSPRSAVAAK